MIVFKDTTEEIIVSQILQENTSSLSYNKAKHINFGNVQKQFLSPPTHG